MWCSVIPNAAGPRMELMERTHTGRLGFAGPSDSASALSVSQPPTRPKQMDRKHTSAGEDSGAHRSGK